MKGEWHENRRTQCYLAEKCNGKRLMANVKKCAREGAFFVFLFLSHNGTIIFFSKNLAYIKKKQ